MLVIGAKAMVVTILTKYRFVGEPGLLVLFV